MLPVFILERKIFLIELTEIQCLFLEGDSFTGVILKSHTTTVIQADTAFGAKDRAVIQFGAIKAVGAGFCNLFPKQHKVRLFSHDF